MLQSRSALFTRVYLLSTNLIKYYFIKLVHKSFFTPNILSSIHSPPPIIFGSVVARGLRSFCTIPNIYFMVAASFFFIVVGLLSCQRFVSHLFLLNRVCVQKRYRLPSSLYPRSSFCYSRSLTQLSKFPAKGVICLHLVSIHSHSDSDGPDSFLSPLINSSLYLSRRISLSQTVIPDHRYQQYIQERRKAKHF